MRRLTHVRLPPLAWVAIAAGVTAVLRFGTALLVETPLYYPDEYLSTALSRAIGEGSLEIRGAHLPPTYTSYGVPLVQSPIWLIDDVDLAYRFAQALGTIAFVSAVLPVFALARRLALSASGSVLVCVLTLAVPAGAFSSTLLTEPYTYPLLLVALLLGVNALTKPTATRYGSAIAAAIALCFVGGLQFLFVGLAYVVAWCVVALRPLAVLRRIAIVSTAAGGAALLLVTSESRYADLLVGGITYSRYPPREIAVWLGVNAFVLAVAAGWVLVPGAVIGLWRLAGSRRAQERAFAGLGISLLAGMLLEAALWGANGHGIYERFAFYGAPVLALAFVWFAERAIPTRSFYAAIGYLVALAVVLVPVLQEPRLTIDADHSPTLNGLSQLTYGEDFGGLVWAPVLAVLAIVIAWRRVVNPRILMLVAICVCAFTTIGASADFIRTPHASYARQRVDTASGSALLTWPGGSRFALGDVLFWNPSITRVVLLDPGDRPSKAPDSRAFIRAKLSAAGFVDFTGKPVKGPFVLGPDALAIGSGASGREREPYVVLPDGPSLLAFGWHREVGRISIGGFLFAAADEAKTVALRLTSNARRSKTIGFWCGRAFERRVQVGRRPASILIPVQRGRATECRFGLVSGTVERAGGWAVIAEAEIELRP